MWSWGRLGTRPQTMSRSRLDARSEGRGSMLDLDLDLELDSEPRSRSSSMPEPAQVLEFSSDFVRFLSVSWPLSNFCIFCTCCTC